MLRYIYVIIFFLISSSQIVKAQDFSNAGKEFWITSGFHVGMVSGGNPTMTLYITSDQSTSYQVEIWTSPTTLITSGNLTAGQVVSVNIPSTYFTGSSGVHNNKAIRVTSAKNVVVYSYITRSAVSGATVCLPTNVLGREYISTNYTQVSNENNSNSYFSIIAVEDNTTVEIIPSGNTNNGWLAGSVNTVTLNKGQIYQVLGNINATATGGLWNGVDLTGSKIRSISSGANGCQKIAVFSGAGKIRIGTSCGSSTSSDNLYQQLYPKASWGKRFVTVPSYSRTFNFFRIIKSDPTANVFLNGALIPSASFNANNVYEFSNATVNYINSDKSVSVSQYFTTQGCDGNASPYDPDMIVLNPIEQNINKVTLVSSNLVATPSSTHQHHIHVIIPNAGTAISSFRFDGAPITNPGWVWTPVPGLPNYSYLYLNGVSQGYHTLRSDSGFNAIVYGYANAESYGYSAGANVKDLFQFATVSNQFADTSITFAAACKNSPFSFFQRLPYKPLSITWDFTTSGLPNPPFANYTNNTPSTILVDSTFVVDRWVYRYKNPNSYTVTNAGTYPITVFVNNPTSDGCSGIQEIEYNLEVFDAPVADFNWTHTGCATDTVFLTENSTVTGGRPVFKWRWLYHDNTTDSIKAPKKLYNVGGNYNIKLQIVTDVGCVSDTLTKTITMTAPPTCTLSLLNGGNIGCLNVPVTVVPNCNVAGGGGTLVKWIYNWGDGSPNDTLTTSANATHTYTTAGNFVITLTSISSTNCKSAPATLNITIHTASTVDFTMPTNVCLPYGLSTFTNTSNGGVPTGTYTWNFGDASPIQSAVNGTHQYTAVGPFTVTLNNINAFGCAAQVQKTFNNIRPQPSSNFISNPEICIKDSLAFTSNASGNGGNIATYNWDFGDGTTSTLQNPKKKWSTGGTKTILHWITTDQGCSSDTTQKTIFVNESPTNDFTFPNTGRCSNTPITFTPTTTSNNGIVNQWNWSWGDGSLVQTVTNGNPIQHSYTTEGTYLVKLWVQTDKGCVADTVTKTLIITARPIAAFTLPTAVCLPIGTATFTNSTSISDGTLATVTYVWNFGDASPTSTVTNPTHNYAGVGPYNVTLTATSAIGCVDDSVRQLVNIYAMPTASITGNNEVCLNENITFTSTANPVSGTIAEHYWDNGTGTFVLGAATATTSFATTGNKTIRHYIKTSNGCISDTATKTILVNPLPTASFTISNLKCERDAITFTSTAVPNAGTLTEWTWNWGDGTLAQTVNNANPLTHVFATAGNYSVTLTVKTDKGCVSAVSSQNIIVNPKPTANFDLPANVCLPIGLATFTNTTTIAGGTIATNTYVWNFGDASPTTITTNGIHNYTAVGPFNVNLQATSNQGCVHDTIKIFNNVRPRPNASFTTNPEVCVNANITFTSTSNGNGGTITEHYWDNGTGTFVLGAATATTSFATNGTKTIRHYIKTDQGCISDTATNTIYVNALPVISFTVSNPRCQTKDVTFTSTSTTADGVINNYVWDFGDGSATVTTATNTPQIHSYTTTGNFTATLTVTTDKGCTNSTVSQPVTIFPNPVIKMYLPEICLNDPIAQFLDSSTIADGTEAGFTYLWNFGDPNATITNPNTSTVKNPTHIYIQAANYNMWLEITSANGCKTRKDTMFTVNGATPAANFNVLNANNLCVNKDVVIENTSTVNFGVVTQLEIYWDWLNNPLLKTVDANPTPNKQYAFSYPQFGTPPTKSYTIRMVAYSGAITGPCNNAIVKTITVLGSPTVVFNAVPEICQEAPAAVLTQAQETTGIPGVGVFTGPGIVANNFNPNNAGVGTHTIRYTFTANNGCNTFKEQTVTVNPTPNANAGPPSITILDGGTGLLPASTSSTNVTYLWSPATWLSSSTILQPTTSAIDDITYTLTVTSAKGCKASDQIFVKVLKGPRVPNAFSPNGDGINDRWDIEYLDTYPGALIEVFNIYGQKVYSSIGYGTPWDGKFKGQTLPVGTYYYIIEPKNGRKPITGYVGIVK
jgi:gliding motility-associated-like protein